MASSVKLLRGSRLEAPSHPSATKTMMLYPSLIEIYLKGGFKALRFQRDRLIAWAQLGR